MDKQKALELAKKHFNDLARTKPSERTAAVKEAVKFWGIVVEALNEKS